jgi:putative colanic acid biosynthesis UDP-glucose lipid carrier transferase
MIPGVKIKQATLLFHLPIWAYETWYMKNEQEPLALQALPPLKIVEEADAVSDTAPYFQLKNGVGRMVNLSHIITPFNTQPLDKGFNRALKRSLDILLSALFIVFVLSWLTPVIALLIKLNSRGPVFFLQKRNKRNGELFTCIKFRSMHGNADADTLPAGKNDNRITGMGRFLRHYHLDELPQFFNVLWGDMSIIGPRPHMVSDNLKFDELIKYYAYRHKVKPGITGLAQMMGYHGHVDDLRKMETRVNMDIFYARHWSPKLDLIILYRTIRKTLGI